MPNYTSSKGQSGSGVLLYIGGPSGTANEQFTPITEVMEIPTPNPTWKTATTTNLQSSIEESIKTLLGQTSVTIKGTRVPTDAGQQALLAAYRAPGPYDFKMVFPVDTLASQSSQGDTFTWAANVLRYGPGTIKAEDVIGFELDMQLTTSVTYTQGS